jgi:hypothetical protein
MNSQNNAQKIIGIAMIMSIVQFIGALIFLEKIKFIALPQGDISIVETLAFSASGLFIISYLIFNKKALIQKDKQEKTKFLIIAYALNEIPVVLAFAATFLREDGNGIVMTINSSCALIINAIYLMKSNQ